MAEEESKQESAPEGETSAPLEAVMKEQIDKEVDAAFPAKPAPVAAPAHALNSDDEAASDAEAQKVLLDEVAAASVSPSPSGEGAPQGAGEGLKPKTSPSPSDAADPLAAGRAASAEAVSAAEREGLIEKPAEPEAKPEKKSKPRPEKSAKPDEPAAPKKPSKLAAVFRLPGSLLATVLELADRPFTFVDPEVRNILGVAGLVILGVSAALIILRLKSLL
jgi:hypothetical protein